MDTMTTRWLLQWEAIGFNADAGQAAQLASIAAEPVDKSWWLSHRWDSAESWLKWWAQTCSCPSPCCWHHGQRQPPGEQRVLPGFSFSLATEGGEARLRKDAPTSGVWGRWEKAYLGCPEKDTQAILSCGRKTQQCFPVNCFLITELFSGNICVLRFGLFKNENSNQDSHSFHQFLQPELTTQRTELLNLHYRHSYTFSDFLHQYLVTCLWFCGIFPQCTSPCCCSSPSLLVWNKGPRPRIHSH